ncbi:DUF4194 domain-containing protein [Trichlorobacter lovleyi]|uniref:DUF4194 domain-containing protein n=1 Tax=Trichlorobacter lovleyi TaxID=313985 RepID=UPI0024800B7A|nr:DUF4194 domain-containing protein [Trichlorobacter lovleyi]
MALSYADSAEIRSVTIHLLKTILYKDSHPKLWISMLNNMISLENYFQIIGLRLYVDEAEGHAYLKQDDCEDDFGQPVPTLIRKQALTFSLSLMCVLLRKALVEHEASSTEARLILGKNMIRELLLVYYPEQLNQAKLIGKIDADIKKLIDYGILRELKIEGEQYEVMRILKSFVNAQWLADFNQKLEEYASHARASA